MRLFVAINVSNEIKNYLFTLRDSISISGNINKVKDTHFTLKFLGETADSKINAIITALNKIKFNSFEVKLHNFGFFPNENYIRVLWIGIKPEENTVELQNKVDNSLSTLFPKEKQFKAHLTIARVKFINNKEQFLKQLKKVQIEPKELVIEKFSLIKSTLTKEGPRYETIKEFLASKTNSDCNHDRLFLL